MSVSERCAEFGEVARSCSTGDGVPGAALEVSSHGDRLGGAVRAEKENLLTREVLGLLRVGRTTLNGLIRRKLLTPIRPSGAARGKMIFARIEVDRYLASRRSGGDETT